MYKILIKCAGVTSVLYQTDSRAEYREMLGDINHEYRLDRSGRVATVSLEEENDE